MKSHETILQQDLPKLSPHWWYSILFRSPSLVGWYSQYIGRNRKRLINHYIEHIPVISMTQTFPMTQKLLLGFVCGLSLRWARWCKMSHLTFRVILLSHGYLQGERFRGMGIYLPYFAWGSQLELWIEFPNNRYSSDVAKPPLNPIIIPLISHDIHIIIP